MRRAAAAVLTVAGLTLVLVAVMGAVLVGPRGEWRAQGRVAGGSTAVVVDSTLAAVLGPRVGLQVRAADPDVRLFLGRTSPDDARALVRGTPTADVVGLDGARRLDVRSTTAAGATTGEAPATGAPATDAPAASATTTLLAPSSVDVWHQSAEGTGSARLEWAPSPGAASFVVARADGATLPALDLTMTWRDAGWRWLAPAVLLLGLVLLVCGWLLRPRRRGAHAAEAGR